MHQHGLDCGDLLSTVSVQMRHDLAMPGFKAWDRVKTPVKTPMLSASALMSFDEEVGQLAAPSRNQGASRHYELFSQGTLLQALMRTLVCDSCSLKFLTIRPCDFRAVSH